MRDLILLIEALNASYADPKRPLYKWGDEHNDKGLSKGFAWLVNYANPDEDAAACIMHGDISDKEHPEGMDYYWYTLPQFIYRNGRQTTSRTDCIGARGFAATMDEAKRACEEALGLPFIGDHDPK